jgi:hypothetical protein
MNTKLFEIRDVGTFIPVIAILMESSDPQEHYLLRRVGYGTGSVLLTHLEGGHPANCDYYEWADNRTIPNAHKYIEEQEHWDELISGQVIDIEFILKESTTPKLSESKTSFIF